MKNIKVNYECASGQTISYQMLQFYLVRTRKTNLRRTITTTLSVREVIGQGNYVGLPSIIDNKKKKSSSLS